MTPEQPDLVFKKEWTASSLHLLREQRDRLTTEDGLLNTITRHNADEFAAAVAGLVAAVGRLLEPIPEHLAIQRVEVLAQRRYRDS